MVLAEVKQLTHALKEWAIAVDALTAGETVVLLRKGGIKERSFQVKYPSIWLYPTYEHQKPQLLKPKYASAVVPVESGWHPTTVTIKSCAEISDVLSIDSESKLEALLPYHIWNQETIAERFRWKPRQPLMLLLLRVYRLAQPQVIPYNNAYGGCKSWIDLAEPLTSDRLTPAITSDRYERIVREIKNLIIS